jgi:hypothetical protein
MKILLWLGLSWMSSMASAAVTITVFTPPTAMPSTGGPYHYDLNADSVNDVSFTNYLSPYIGLNMSPIQSSLLRVQSFRSDRFTLYPLDLAHGDLIGPTPIGNSSYYNEFTPNGVRFGYTLATGFLGGDFGGEAYQDGFFVRPVGLTPATYTAFLGFEFMEPDGAHYGYMEMRMLVGTTVGSVLSIGYETTPGVAITAYHSPEPSRSALLCASAVLTCCRRRRRGPPSSASPSP